MSSAEQALIERAKAVARMPPGHKRWLEATRVKEAAEAMAPHKMRIAHKTAASLASLQKKVMQGAGKKTKEGAEMKELSLKLKIQSEQMQVDRILRKKTAAEVKKRLAAQSELLKAHIIQHNKEKGKGKGKGKGKKSKPSMLGETSSQGHMHCKHKVKVATLSGANAKNKAAKEYDVCEECKAGGYALVPSHVVSGRVYGTCKSLEQHALWKESSDLCGREAMPCHGDSMPLKCHQFVESSGSAGDGENTSLPTAADDSKKRPLAFTCGRIYTSDFSDSVHAQVNATHVSGKIYRIVQSTVVSCHAVDSQVEKEAPDLWERISRRPAGSTMSCVNKKMIKSCYMRLLEVKKDSVTTVSAAFKVAQEEAFKFFDASTSASKPGTWQDEAGYVWETCSNHYESNGVSIA